MKIHITDGPLKCKECGKQFTTSGRGTRQKWFSFFFFFCFLFYLVFSFIIMYIDIRSVPCFHMTTSDVYSC